MGKLTKDLARNSYFSVIAGTASIAGIIVPIWKGKPYLSLVCLVLIGIIIYLIITIYGLTERIKYIIRNYIRNTVENIGEGQHKFFHQYRNYIAQMSRGDYDTDETFEMLVKSICDYVEDFFRTLLGTKVSVCIKSVVNETPMNDDDDVNTWQIRTLARSAASKIDRSINDNTTVSVKDNTDFQMILTEHNHHFASANLKKTIDAYRKEKNDGFRNSTENYLEKYKSVIVVPIRIKSELVSSSISIPMNTSNKTHYVIGFLCIDSLSTFDNDGELFKSATDFAKAFGDSLYTLFEIFYEKNSNKRKTLYPNN